jgi:CTP-dependent riboflavin kinase
MVSVKGHVVKGCGHFRQRMTTHRDVFTRAAGEELYPGTMNVKIDRKLEIKEKFRIRGAEIGELGQDLLFEECLINGIKAYRIRPYVLGTGGGGHGDDTIEIASASYIANAKLGTKVELTFFRDLT